MKKKPKIIDKGPTIVKKEDNISDLTDKLNNKLKKKKIFKMN